MTDPLAEWNSRIFGLKKGGDESSVQIVDKPIGKSVELDIQTLWTLMMSYKSPAYLYKIGRIKTDVSTLHLLDKLTLAGAPYISDYF